jgi:hypothetical protein
VLFGNVDDYFACGSGGNTLEAEKVVRMRSPRGTPGLRRESG